MIKTLPIAGRWLLVRGALNAGPTVGLGAAGMHNPKAHLTTNGPGGWFQTALHYHQLHTLGLLAIGALILGWLMFTWGSGVPARLFHHDT